MHIITHGESGNVPVRNLRAEYRIIQKHLVAAYLGAKLKFAHLQIGVARHKPPLMAEHLGK